MQARDIPFFAEKDDIDSNQAMIEEFRKFRKKHDLGSDSFYDDLLAEVISEQLVTLDMETAIAAIAHTFYRDHPDKVRQEEKRKKLIENLSQTLYLHIFSRIKRHADKQKYDLKSYYQIGQKNDPYKNGVRSRDIIKACKDQYNAFFNLLENYNKAPASADLQFDDPDQKHSTMSDTIETLTGMTDKAATAGSKLTAGSIVYSGNSTKFHVFAAQAFSIASFVINVVDFLLIPLGYIYKLVKKEPVPFNKANNIRWALASISLGLAITSMMFPPAALGIAITTAAITLTISTITFVQFFYHRHNIKRAREAVKQCLREVKALIIADQEEAYRIRKDIRISMNSDKPQITVIDELNEKLQAVNRRFADHTETFKELAREKKALDIAHHQHRSYAEIGSNVVKLLLSGMVIAGAILIANPVTAPIAIGLAAGAAVIGLGIMIVKKILQVRHKRKERELENQLGHTTTVKFDTTAKMMEKLYASKDISPPTHEDRVIRITKRLRQITKLNNPASVIEFFLACERKLNNTGLSSREFDEIFYDIPAELHNKTFDLLQKGIESVKNGELFLKTGQKETLEKSDLLYSLFHNNGVDVDFMRKSLRRQQTLDNNSDDSDSDSETRALLDADELHTNSPHI